MAPDTKYMTIEEVAELLGVTYQLIYRLVRSGELPAVRIGRVYRITGTDLDACLEQTKTGGGPVGTACAACGKIYASASSVKEECMDCGALICLDCRQRRGVHQCRKCAESALNKEEE